MNLTRSWIEKLRVSSGIDDAARILAWATGEMTSAVQTGVFLLDNTRGNLLFVASWSAHTGAVLESKQAVPSFDLADPLCLALQKGEPLTSGALSGMERPPSLALLDALNAPERVLRIYPLIAWQNATIGGMMSRYDTDIPVSDAETELLCAYSALLIASLEQRNQDEAHIADLHGDVTRLELSCSPAETTVGSLLIGQSPAMKKVREQIVQVAPHTVSVLITGETGTGKELTATAIHAVSPRSKAPLVKINCGALPAQLLESELFGHKKGAFSGAQTEHIGLLRSAEHGTVLLDEVGEMPLELQVKLLRVLQEHEVRPVGDVRSYPVDIRVISATNKNLEKAVAKGTFRKDLYYRLAAYHIHIPPLHERREDIQHLSIFFLEKYKNKYNANNIQISHKEMIEICSYEYPGNIRELAAKIENLIISTNKNDSKTILNTNKLQNTYTTNKYKTFDEYVSSYEQSIIDSALHYCDGNAAKAARALGMPRTSLITKLRKYSEIKQNKKV